MVTSYTNQGIKRVNNRSAIQEHLISVDREKNERRKKRKRYEQEFDETEYVQAMVF